MLRVLINDLEFFELIIRLSGICTVTLEPVKESERFINSLEEIELKAIDLYNSEVYGKTIFIVVNGDSMYKVTTPCIEY